MSSEIDMEISAKLEALVVAFLFLAFGLGLGGTVVTTIQGQVYAATVPAATKWNFTGYRANYLKGLVARLHGSSSYNSFDTIDLLCGYCSRIPSYHLVSCNKIQLGDIMLQLEPLFFSCEINLLNLNADLGNALGIGALAGGTLLTMILTFMFISLPVLKKSYGIAMILAIFSTSFCIAVGWIPIYIFAIMILAIALGFAKTISEIIAKTGV